MDSELNAWRVGAGRLADVQLMAELRQLARVDRRCEARILVLLAEVDERELFLAEGYSSLFRYAVCVLRMSEAQAYLRIGAARVARSYPAVLETLVEGALNLSTVKLLGPQLTAENQATLLERARNKTKREVELLVAEIAPKPDVQTRIRKMPGRPGQSGSLQAELVMSAAPDVQDTTVAISIAPAGMAPHAAAATAPAVAAAVAPRGAAAFALESPRASCSVLSPGRYRLELTVDQALFDQMMTLKHLLKHRIPSGDRARYWRNQVLALRMVKRPRQLRGPLSAEAQLSMGRRRSNAAVAMCLVKWCERCLPAMVRSALLLAPMGSVARSAGCWSCIT